MNEHPLYYVILASSFVLLTCILFLAYALIAVWAVILFRFRRGTGLRRRHGLVRNGIVARESAVESAVKELRDRLRRLNRVEA